MPVARGSCRVLRYTAGSLSNATVTLAWQELESRGQAPHNAAAALTWDKLGLETQNNQELKPEQHTESFRVCRSETLGC